MSLSIHAKMCIIHINFLSCNTFSFSLIKSAFLKLLQTPGKQTLLDFIFLVPLNGFTDSMDMGMSKLRESVMGREAWHAPVQGATKGWT